MIKGKKQFKEDVDPQQTIKILIKDANRNLENTRNFSNFTLAKSNTIEKQESENTVFRHDDDNSFEDSPDFIRSTAGMTFNEGPKLMLSNLTTSFQRHEKTTNNLFTTDKTIIPEEDQENT